MEGKVVVVSSMARHRRRLEQVPPPSPYPARQSYHVEVCSTLRHSALDTGEPVQRLPLLVLIQSTASKLVWSSEQWQVLSTRRSGRRHSLIPSQQLQNSRALADAQARVGSRLGLPCPPGDRPLIECQARASKDRAVSRHLTDLQNGSMQSSMIISIVGPKKEIC